MKKNKEYYAVLKGRVEEPTIFSSWGDAHPRVTGCASVHQGFETLAEAQKQMERWGAPNPLVILKHEDGPTTPLPNTNGYYAVACGSLPGIYHSYNGTSDAESQVKGVSGACHKHFRSKQQAEEFIEDWKQSYVEVFTIELKRALDQGLRPRDLKLSLKDVLQEWVTVDKLADSEVSYKMERLGIKDEK